MRLRHIISSLWPGKMHTINVENYIHALPLDNPSVHTIKTDDHIQELPLNNPFVPPKGDVCFINDLPPELLSHIFEVGAEDNDEDDDDDMQDYLDTLYDDLDGEDDEDEEDEEDDTGTDEDEEEPSDEETDEGEGSDATGSSDFSWPSFQVVASHVCRHWRDVALSTPSLWTTIELTPICRPPWRRVSTMLERSKSLPIDIFLDCEVSERDCPAPNCQCTRETARALELRSLYTLLIPHIHRWRSVRVEVPAYNHIYAFLSALSNSAIPAAPQLTSLELYHHEETEMDELAHFRFPKIADHFVLFGGSAPHLTRVILWGVHVDWDQPWIASSSTLKELQLAFHQEDVRPSWSQFATILRGASSLENLSLEMSGPCGDPKEWFFEPIPGGSTDLNAPIQLPKVQVLTLAFHSERRAIGLLHKLCLPALKELALDFDEGNYTDFANELAKPATSMPGSQEKPRSLISRIEKLKISGLPCRPECAETLYQELQNLRSLNISATFIPEQFLYILSDSREAAGHSDVLLPRLATLYVSDTCGEDMREVVKRRKEVGVPLESLHMEQSCSLTKRDVKWFKENLKTFEIFEGSDDEDIDEIAIDYEDMPEEIDDEWSDIE